eukprot:TRINITY_DN8787_c0_g1_i1.p1 TRINITY_DN8787_c0_g1~~TRINITY_DN8787_c0_g1_i1.p1  ORF type:complete len:146 (+),score=31.59 TRINITY_DN8787_c0_g1_i1:125-562(+)
MSQIWECPPMSRGDSSTNLKKRRRGSITTHNECSQDRVAKRFKLSESTELIFRDDESSCILFPSNMADIPPLVDFDSDADSVLSQVSELLDINELCKPSPYSVLSYSLPPSPQYFKLEEDDEDNVDYFNEYLPNDRHNAEFPFMA